MTLNNYKKNNYYYNTSNDSSSRCLVSFLEENIRCKESLVSSSCDQRVTRFASSFLEISMQREEAQCQRNDDFNYTGPLRQSFISQRPHCTSHYILLE